MEKSKIISEQGIKKSRLQCWKDLIGEVEKDPWGLAFKKVNKRLVTRRKTPGLDNADRVEYIVGSLFPHVEPFQRQDRSSCVVRSEELYTLEDLKRAGGRLNANTAPGIVGLPNEILKEVFIGYDGETSGGNDPTKTTGSHGPREWSLGIPVWLSERQVHT